MNKKNIIITALFLIFSAYAFLVFDTGFSGPDEPVYFAYTKSICETGDLNITELMVNENPHFIVSQTKNFPDFHANASIVFWAPFYLAGKIAANHLGTFSAQTAKALVSTDTMCRMFLSFSNLLMSLVTIVLAFVFTRRFVTPTVAAACVFFVFWGSGFFHFALFQTANPNIPGTMCAFILYLCAFRFKDFQMRDWFLFGILSQLCISVRLELLSTLAVLSCMWGLLVWWRKIKISSLPVALLGFLIPLVLRMTNSWLKFGFIHLEEMSYVNLLGGTWGAINYNALTSNYRGLLYTCPIFLVAGAGWIQSIRQCFSKHAEFKRLYKNTLLVLGGLVIIYKLYRLIPLFNPGGIIFNTPRLMLTSLPELTALCTCASLILPKLKGYVLWWILCPLCILWMFAQVSVQMTPFEWFNIAAPISFMDRWELTKSFLKLLITPRQLLVKIYFLPAVAVLGAATAITVARIRKIKNDWKMTAFRVLTLYMLCMYILITLLNLQNNKKNVVRAERQNRFEHSRTTKNFDNDTVLWLLYEHMRYSLLKQDISHTNFLVQQLETLFADKEFLNVEYLKPQNYGFDSIPVPKTLEYFQPAMQLCGQLIDQNPDNTKLRMLLSDFYMCASDPGKSIETLEPTMNTKPVWYNSQRRLLDAYTKAKRPENVLKQLRSLVDQFPGSYESRINLSESLLGAGHVDEAEILVDQALAKTSSDQILHRIKGTILLLKGEPEQAEKSYFTALKHATPTDPTIFFRMADFYKGEGQFRLSKAFEQTGKYVKEHKSLPYFDAWNQTGADFRAALKDFLQSKNRPI